MGTNDSRRFRWGAAVLFLLAAAPPLIAFASVRDWPQERVLTATGWMILTGLWSVLVLLCAVGIGFARFVWRDPQDRSLRRGDE